MNQTEVYLIGCGGNSKVVVDICLLNNFKIIGFFDDRYNGIDIGQYMGIKIIGKIDDIFKYQNINIINSIGDNFIRNKIYQNLSVYNLNWINCIHPKSYISPSAKIGTGNIICYGSFVNCDTIIGDFNLINTYAIIEHDCRIGNFNHIAPKSTLCGGITLGNINLIGAGTTIIPSKKIGNCNVIGAMTVIVKDIDNNNIIVGIPGKNIKTSQSV